MLEFSVVIPVYNRKKIVRRAIESVINQTHPAREIFVVDDGSTDGTAEELELDYPETTVLKQANSGVSTARNRGITASRADWISFLDSDDEWLPEKLERQAQWIANHPNYLLCHCDEYWIRNGVRVNPGIRHAKSGGWLYFKCLPLCVISPSAVVIHRKVFSDVGLFDQKLPACEDYDLWLRITQKYPVGYLDQKLLIKYGGHEDQLSKTTPAIDQFRITALVKLLEQGTLSADQRIKTIETLFEKSRIYMNGALKREKMSEVSRCQAILDRYQHEI